MRGGHSLRAPVPHAGRPRSSGSRPPVRHTAARAAGRRCLAGPTPVAPSRDLPASACARSTLPPASACSTVALRERPPRVCRGVLTCERSVRGTIARRSSRGVASRRLVPEGETRMPSASAGMTHVGCGIGSWADPNLRPAHLADGRPVRRSIADRPVDAASPAADARWLRTPGRRGAGVPGARLGARRRQRQRRVRAGGSPRVARRRDLISAAAPGAVAERPAAAGACSTGVRKWSAEGMLAPHSGRRRLSSGYLISSLAARPCYGRRMKASRSAI